MTTERSFNAETFAFQATDPLTIAIEAKDFNEDESGIEYIGQPNQQMGDGGLIAQVTDDTTGEVVAVTDGTWQTLVIHRAPSNTECESDADPTATCESEVTEAPADWTSFTRVLTRCPSKLYIASRTGTFSGIRYRNCVSGLNGFG